MPKGCCQNIKLTEIDVSDSVRAKTQERIYQLKKVANFEIAAFSSHSISIIHEECSVRFTLSIHARCAKLGIFFYQNPIVSSAHRRKLSLRGIWQFLDVAALLLQPLGLISKCVV